MPPEQCTCGTELPAGARFCHSCGKPQGAAPLPEVILAEQADAPPPAPPPVSFENHTAVRVGFLVASVAAPASLLLTLGPLYWMLWMFLAGFGAAFLYRRRTAQSLTISGGARLGWITGVLSFLIQLVLLTVMIVSFSFGTPGGIIAALREQIPKMPIPPDTARQALEVLQNPSMFAMAMVFFLLMLFVMVTSASTAGGALGGKLGGRN